MHSTIGSTTLHAFEQFGALYMHGHDDQYPSLPGIEPGTPRLQDPVDTNEPSRKDCEGTGGCGRSRDDLAHYRDDPCVCVSMEVLKCLKPPWAFSPLSQQKSSGTGRTGSTPRDTCKSPGSSGTSTKDSLDRGPLEPPGRPNRTV